MATVNRGYETPATGALDGTWGDLALNPNFEKIDRNLGGVATVALTDVNVTLSSNQYENGTIRFTGALTGHVIVTFPSVSAWWLIDNQTTGNFVVQLTCGGGRKICTQPGVATRIFADGSNVDFEGLDRIGAYWDYAGTTVPLWVQGCTIPPYLHCIGGSFSPVTYPQLAVILGGTTLPDARGRNRSYLDGGTGRITAVGSGINGNLLFAAGGDQLIQSHRHGAAIFDPGHLHGMPYYLGSPVFNPSFPAIPTQNGTANAIGNNTTATTGVLVTDGAGNFGVTALFGSGNSQNMPPTFMGGITMIRAA